MQRQLSVMGNFDCIIIVLFVNSYYDKKSESPTIVSLINAV